MQIRKCTEQDLERVAVFYDKVTAYLEKHINYPKWIHGSYPGRESVCRAIRDGSQYMGEEDGRILGAFIMNDDPQGDYSAGEWVPQLKGLDKGEYMVIHAFATDPEAYHRGLGRKMTAYCIETAQRQGARSIRLDVVPENLPARRLYEKMGFRYAGEKDLKRGIDEIPRFALYEFVLDPCVSAEDPCNKT